MTTTKKERQADLQRRLGLHDNEYAKLEQLAAKGDRTVAAEVRRAIRQYLEAQSDETLERLAAEHGWGSREVRDYCDDRMALVPDE